jgi:hypothetical protein
MADVGGASNGVPVLFTVTIGIVSAVTSAILTWFGNILVMREKFISKGECRQCQKTAEREGELEIKALEVKMGNFETALKSVKDQQESMQETVGTLDERTFKIFGMTSEIHGHLFGPGNASKAGS